MLIYMLFSIDYEQSHVKLNGWNSNQIGTNHKIWVNICLRWPTRPA